LKLVFIGDGQLAIEIAEGDLGGGPVKSAGGQLPVDLGGGAAQAAGVAGQGDDQRCCFSEQIVAVGKIDPGAGIGVAGVAAIAAGADGALRT